MEPPAEPPAGPPQEEDDSALDPAAIIASVRSFMAARLQARPSAREPMDVGEEQGEGLGEQVGCLLWDASSSEAVATVMVKEGLVLDVLETVLTAELIDTAASTTEALQPEARILEICLGILGRRL